MVLNIFIYQHHLFQIMQLYFNYGAPSNQHIRILLHAIF